MIRLILDMQGPAHENETNCQCVAYGSNQLSPSFGAGLHTVFEACSTECHRPTEMNQESPESISPVESLL